MDYATADREAAYREHWGISLGSEPDLGDLWGSGLGKQYEHKSSYLSGRRRNGDKRAEVYSFADGSIDRLRQRYEFAGDIDVEDFLRENPFLIEVLLRAHAKVGEYFEPDNSLALRVAKEPDSRDDRRLFLLVRTRLRPKDALNRLDELDRDWWFDALSTAQGKLTVDVEYV